MDACVLARLSNHLALPFRLPNNCWRVCFASFLMAKALDRGGICKIFDLLSLSQADHDDLRYEQDDGTDAFLSIGHKGMLKTLKLFTAYNVAKGHPIDDWTQVTKKNFDDFRSSSTCITATEKTTTLWCLIYSGASCGILMVS